jgi:hypothetical protein
MTLLLVHKEIRTFAKLYVWLKVRLLCSGEKKLFNAKLVDFADQVLEYAAKGLTWYDYRESYGVSLGDVLKLTAETREQKEYSVVAMEFVGHLWEMGCMESASEEEVCIDLIDWLGLEPEFFTTIEKGEKEWLVGTSELERVSGMRLKLRKRF